jgi:putative flippase GtrA
MLDSNSAMFLRFLVVGGLGFVIDAGLTYILIQLGIAPWLARLPAIVCAATFTWLANRYFTYQMKTSRSAGEAIRYASVASAMAFINYVIFLMLIQIGLEPVVSIILATALQTLISFYAYRRFAFKLPAV